MLSATELILLALIVFVVFGLHKLPQISRGLARLRLSFDKGLSEEYIEAIVEEEEVDDDEPSGETDSGQNRGT